MNTNYIKAAALALILVCSPSLTLAAIPTVSLNLLDGDIYVGESFDVQVLTDGDNIGLDLLTFGFDVTAADGIFSYDDYMIESGFDDLSAIVPPDVSGLVFPGITADDVLLATLSFTALTPGTGALQTLGITDLLFYGLAYEIDPITNDWYDINATLNITVREGLPQAVPEPSLIILLSVTAITVLPGFGRKLKRL